MKEVNEMQKILVIEDELNICKLISYNYHRKYREGEEEHLFNKSLTKPLLAFNNGSVR
ncbi:MAG: hypothetical protein PHN73_05155 [Eubacteriales bacterium]|nr:hypothetical protein [Eubacteriales bacterium]